jgi:hypothetical protein
MLPQRKTTLGGHHTNESSEGNYTEPLCRRRRPGGPTRYEIRGITLSLASSPFAPDDGDELWALPGQQRVRRVVAANGAYLGNTALEKFEKSGNDMGRSYT